MRQLIRALALFVLYSWALSCTSTVSEISEEDVRNIMDSVQAATVNRDIEGVIMYLAPDVIINITSETTFGRQRIRMTRDEYKEETERAWSMVTEYEYGRENAGISLSDDRKSATVEADVLESMMVGGQRIRTNTHEAATLEIVEGRLLVTVLEAVVKRL